MDQSDESRGCTMYVSLEMPKNVQAHQDISNELTHLYWEKNKAYGNSFHATWEEEGYAMARIRLTDKLERFKTLTRTCSDGTDDESVRDTLLDMANYCIMTVMEMDQEKGNR